MGRHLLAAWPRSGGQVSGTGAAANFGCADCATAARLLPCGTVRLLAGSHLGRSPGQYRTADGPAAGAGPDGTQVSEDRRRGAHPPQARAAAPTGPTYSATVGPDVQYGSDLAARKALGDSARLWANAEANRVLDDLVEGSDSLCLDELHARLVGRLCDAGIVVPAGSLAVRRQLERRLTMGRASQQ